MGPMFVRQQSPGAGLSTTAVCTSSDRLDVPMRMDGADRWCGGDTSATEGYPAGPGPIVPTFSDRGTVVSTPPFVDSALSATCWHKRQPMPHKNTHVVV